MARARMKLGGRWLVALAGLLVAGRSASAGSTDYLTLVDDGLTLAEQGQWELAGRRFEEATRTDPDDALAYAGLGLTELAQRRSDVAASYFRRADETDRADAVARLGLGLCYFETGDLSTAQTLFQEASQLESLLFAPYFYRAVIAMCRGRLDDAPELLRRADDLGAPSLVVEYLTALRLFAAGRRQSASDIVRRLKPRLATTTPGLPLALPLTFTGQPGAAVAFSVPPRGRLSEAVAPRAVAPEVPVVPASYGPLTVEAPLPGEVVSGRLPIRATLRQPRSYKYITISVDGQLKGMANREPFYVAWDTTNLPDGPHRITVKALGGVEVEVSFEVIVRNRAQTNANPHDPATWRTAAIRLSRLMLHGGPPLSLEQLLLEAYHQQDPDLAIEFYERLLAKDPSRTDLIDPLLALYRAQGLVYDPARIPEPHTGLAGANRVALTFDDGPRPEYTPPILELLRRYRARATFLVTGRMSEKYPELIRAIAADGHELANHTYNHLHLDGLDRATIVAEMIRTKVVLDEIVGGSSRFFRPPGGHYSPRVRETVAALGYFPLFWNINGGSFAALPPAEAAEAVVRRTSDGAIILLHNGADNTLPMLPYLLPRLKQKGFSCVTASDILRPPLNSTVLVQPELGPLPPSALDHYAGTE